MIWVRRLLAIPLSLLFMWLLIGGLLLIHLEGSLLSPAFYKEQLEKAGVYTFILEDLPRAAVDELRENYPEHVDPDPEVDHPLAVFLHVVDEDAASSVQRAVPSSWLEEQVEQVIDQVGGYLAGKRDDFEVYVPLQDRARALSRESQAVVRYDRLYRLVMDSTVRPEVDRALEDEVSQDLAASLSTDVVTNAIERAFPAEWAKGQVNAALEEATAYMVGNKDTLEVQVTLKGRSNAALAEAKRLLENDETFQAAFDPVISHVLDKNVPDVVALPFGVTVSGEEMERAFLDNMPQEWAEEQGLAALDEAAAYLVGHKDTLEIKIETEEVLRAAIAQVEYQLEEDNDLRFDFDSLIKSALNENVPDVVELPYGVTVTREEIKRAFLGNIPQEWIGEQNAVVVDAAWPYFTGETKTFQALIPMAERKSTANKVVGQLAVKRFTDNFPYLPQCNLDMPSYEWYSPSQDGLPQCIPIGLSRDIFIRLHTSNLENIDLDAVLDDLGYHIPDSVTYTQDHMLKALEDAGGEDSLKALEDFQALIREEWVYTEADLREDLEEAGGDDALESLDYVREVFSQGWTYTDADLRADLMESGGSGDVEALEDFREVLRDGWTFTDADLRQSLRESGGEEAVSNLDRSS